MSLNFYALIPNISPNILSLAKSMTVYELLNSNLLDRKQCIYLKDNYLHDTEKVNNWLCQGKNHYFLDFNSENFPNKLKHIANPPLFLFARGDISCLTNKKVAIVGSRSPQMVVKNLIEELITLLVNNDVLVVSGLAIGIDTIVHKSALNNGGKTIAVLPSNIEKTYPQRNTHLASQISENGIVLSEFPLGFPVIKSNFVRRNRVVTGLCLATIITQASPNSGTMSSANHAVEQNREVLVFPVGFNEKFSQGNYQLIQTGAYCLSSVEETLKIVLSLHE